MTQTTIGAVILAGGRSRRFQGDKRTAQLPSGKTVLQATIELAEQCFDAVVVVLRETEQSLTQEVKVPYVLAPDSDRGMGHSLRAGMQAASGWSAAAVMLADMPFIKPETLNTLIAQYCANSADNQLIIQPVVNHQPGHPVLFGCHYFAEMQQIHGDEGARSVVSRHKNHVIRVPVADEGVIRDIDQPSDLPTS